jgi:hypothetical protein
MALVSAKPRPLPSFFVVGPPRTGTSWLYEVLSTRTLLPSPTKETRFFDNYFHRGFEWYDARYAHAVGDRIRGEIAPTYFASAAARERIGRAIPHAKVVCIFRNPVQRALSLYRLKRAYGAISWSFEEAVTRDLELVESSTYAANFRAWQHVLGKDQVMATVYDDLRDQPQAYLDSLVDFIGVPRFLLSPSQIRYVHASRTMSHPRNERWTRIAANVAEWLKGQRLDIVVAAVKRSPLLNLFLGGGGEFAELSPEASRRLYRLFRPEVDKLEVILNRDLSAWKTG